MPQIAGQTPWLTPNARATHMLCDTSVQSVAARALQALRAQHTRLSNDTNLGSQLEGQGTLAQGSLRLSCGWTHFRVLLAACIELVHARSHSSDLRGQTINRRVAEKRPCVELEYPHRRSIAPTCTQAYPKQTEQRAIAISSSRRTSCPRNSKAWNQFPALAAHAALLMMDMRKGSDPPARLHNRQRDNRIVLDIIRGVLQGLEPILSSRRQPRPLSLPSPSSFAALQFQRMPRQL